MPARPQMPPMRPMCIKQYVERILIMDKKLGFEDFIAAVAAENQEFVREKFQVPAEWLKPAAMILGYAVLNFGFTSRGPLSGEQEEMMQNCNRYITGKEQPEKEDFDKINLLRFVSEDTPPAFLFHLCADPIVPVDNTLQFASRLAAFDIPFALEIGEDAWHGVSSLKAEDANIGFFKSEYAGWFDRAICWLKKKLFVENA